MLSHFQVNPLVSMTSTSLVRGTLRDTLCHRCSRFHLVILSPEKSNLQQNTLLISTGKPAILLQSAEKITPEEVTPLLNTRTPTPQPRITTSAVLSRPSCKNRISKLLKQNSRSSLHLRRLFLYSFFAAPFRAHCRKLRRAAPDGTT